jgi:histidinol phosphatase-like enzyme
MIDNEQFRQIIKNSESKIICLDFDGVIHGGSKGFHDGTIYDDPIEGALENIKYLSELKYTLIIYTCKANPNRPLINGKTGIELIWEWLEKYNVAQYIHDITFTKPNAICYIDDKGIRFDNWAECMVQLKKLKILQ